MKKLLLIYNAESGKINNFLQSLHKVFNPDTYNCSLCTITHGIFAEKKNWKDYKKSSSIPLEFLHRDEFKKQYASKFGYKYSYPIILLLDGNAIDVLVKTEELNAMKNQKELINCLTARQAKV